MSVLNWSELMKGAKGALDPVPDGDYDLQVVDAQAAKSSTDKLMFKVKFEIMTGPNKGRKIPTQLVVSPDSQVAMAIFFKQMEAMGLGAQFFEQNPTPDQITSALTNRTCRGTIGSRVWQGVERNEIKAINPPQSGGPVGPGVAVGPATILPTPGGPGGPQVGLGPQVGPSVQPSKPITPGPTPPVGPPELPI